MGILSLCASASSRLCVFASLRLCVKIFCDRPLPSPLFTPPHPHTPTALLAPRAHLSSLHAHHSSTSVVAIAFWSAAPSRYRLSLTRLSRVHNHGAPAAR